MSLRIYTTNPLLALFISAVVRRLCAESETKKCYMLVLMVLIDLGSAANLALCLQRADNTEKVNTHGARTSYSIFLVAKAMGEASCISLYMKENV